MHAESPSQRHPPRPHLTVTMSLSHWHKNICYFPGQNRVKVQSKDSAPNETKQNYFFDAKKHEDFEDPSCGC